MSDFLWGAKKPPAPVVSDDDDKSTEGSVSQKGNHLYFYTPVTQKSAEEFSKSLRDLVIDMQSKFAPYGGDTPPIHLHIHSYGGSLFSGFAILDAVRNCPIPVHTHVEGGVASAATFFSVAGKRRTIGKYRD